MDVDVQVEGVSYNSGTNATQSEEDNKPAGALGASAEAPLNDALQKNWPAEKSRLQKTKRGQ